MTDSGVSTCSCHSDSYSPAYMRLQPSYISSLAHQEDIDREISVVIDVLSALRTRRNELAPINSLPAETLANIFSYCMPRDGDQRTWPYIEGARFALVCRAWRAIGLEHPSIWSSIPCFDSDLTKMMLARSKRAPIDLHISLPGDANSYRLALALAHLDRTRSLDINFAVTKQFEDVENVLAYTPAPLLQSARFVTQPGVEGFLPDMLFNLDSPRLRTLYIQNCLFNWDILANPSVVGSLISLELVECSSTVAFPGYWQKLRSALNHMPSLSTLNISMLPSSSGDIEHLSTGVVRLQSLRDLELDGNLDEVSAFLRSISIPNCDKFHTSLDISATNFLDNPDLSALDELLRTNVQAFAGGIRKLLIESDYYSNTCSIYGYVGGEEDPPSRSALSITLSRNRIQKTNQEHASRLRYLVTTVWSAIRTKQLRLVDVQMRLRDPLMAAVLRDVCRDAEAVETLHLNAAAVSLVGPLLGASPIAEGGEPRVVLAGLRCLQLTKVDFDDGSDSAPPGLVLSALRSWSHELGRSQLERPLQVHLVRCFVDPHVLEVFREGLENWASVVVS